MHRDFVQTRRRHGRDVGKGARAEQDGKRSRAGGGAEHARFEEHVGERVVGRHRTPEYVADEVEPGDMLPDGAVGRRCQPDEVADLEDVVGTGAFLRHVAGGVDDVALRLAVLFVEQDREGVTFWCGGERSDGPGGAGAVQVAVAGVAESTVDVVEQTGVVACELTEAATQGGWLAEGEVAGFDLIADMRADDAVAVALVDDGLGGIERSPGLFAGIVQLVEVVGDELAEVAAAAVDGVRGDGGDAADGDGLPVEAHGEGPGAVDAGEPVIIEHAEGELGLEGGEARAKVRISPMYAVTVNDEALTERMAPVLRRAADGKVAKAPLAGASEDFSFFAKEVPGLYVFLGCTPDGQDPAKAAPNHNPNFFVDEKALVVGTRTMASLAVNFLATDPTKKDGP